VNRSSGILLHLTSLPSRFGIGDLGCEAFQFADWLAKSGQRIWQVLPLGPTGYGESPYQLFSAFAGNPMLLSLERFVERGWLSPQDLQEPPKFSDSAVEFERVIPWKTQVLHRAFDGFRSDVDFETFCRDRSWWLDDFARFMALKDANGGTHWRDWNPQTTASDRAVDYHRFLQFEFFRQWRDLKSYCAGLGIRMMGDIPIYMSHDSADVWAHPELFRLDAVSGVPPDYFSATGQLWGNPLYHWDRLASDGYRWWVERMQAALELFDLVRMDHFRGFEAFWEVPEGETTAVNGRWVKGPGPDLFRALESSLGSLPIVAENLGVITPEVEAIREEFRFPGMAVLQFAFGSDPQAPSFRPHNYVRNLVAYTGTHDNDTALGWWRSSGGDSTRTHQDVEDEKARAHLYLGTDGEVNWVMIRALLASVADTVLFPMQDVAGVGSEGRMNVPSVAGGNWRWRVTPGQINDADASRLREMVDIFER
jgi:4-alpha-glucanotransferase